MIVYAGESVRAVEEPPITLAHANPFKGDERAVQQGAQLGKDLPDPFSGTYCDHHHGDFGVTAEELGPFTAAVGRSVDAEQRGGAGHAVTMQQIAHRHKGGHAVDAFLAAKADGQLGRFLQFLRKPDGTDLVGQQTGPLQGGEPGAIKLQRLIKHSFDARTVINGDRNERQILGQGQGTVGAQMMLEPESVDAPEQDAGRDLMARVQVDQSVSDECAATAVALTEIAGQLQAVLVHRRIPIIRPSAAAATPSTRLAITLAATLRRWRSSASRSVSNIQVENVV